MKLITKSVGVVVLVAVLLALVPFIPLEPHWGADPRVIAYGSLGAWIQGVLTPLLFVLAILSFREQSKAFRDQNEAFVEQIQTQQTANRIAARAFFVANVRQLSGHLAYRCYCALVDATPPDITIEDSNRGRVLDVLSRMFEGHETANAFRDPNGLAIKSAAEVKGGTHYALLRKDMADIVSLAEDAGLVSLLDNRLVRIHNGLRSDPAPTAAP
jgi:hypothetical protein